MGLDDTLVWYQKKIGAYDKDIWGRNLEQRILRGVNAIPKKTARIKAELIDIDLVRGSTFKKSKPQNSWLALATNGVVRVLLFPLYYSWWKQQTSTGICVFLLVLYFLQLGSLCLHSSQDDALIAENTLTEVLTPIAMMLVLGIMHAQVVATYTTNGQLKPMQRTKARKRPKRKVRSRSNYGGKSSPGTASEDKPDSLCRISVVGGSNIQNNQPDRDVFHHVEDRKNSDEESGLESLSNHNGPEEQYVPQEVQDKLSTFVEPSGGCAHSAVLEANGQAVSAKREPSSDDEEFFVARKQRSRSHDICQEASDARGLPHSVVLGYSADRHQPSPLRCQQGGDGPRSGEPDVRGRRRGRRGQAGTAAAPLVSARPPSRRRR
ncbi:hypothetical protein MRX96_023715 [Rhipicephalus microplus]